MLGTLFAWLVYAAFLKIAIGVATDVSPERNSLMRAFVTAGVLSVSSAVMSVLGPFAILAPIAWLFILKSVYDIGWWRALRVWIALVAIAVLLVVFVLVPLGLMAGVTAAIF